jgi:hypothetical protein
LRTLVAVAGQRWRIKESFQAAKGLGLDQYQVRRWTSWHRWTTWPCSPMPSWPWPSQRTDTTPTPASLIPLTVNEFRRLSDALFRPPTTRWQRCWPGHDGAEDTTTESEYPTPDDGNTMIPIYGCSIRR